jgi:hypothetical protein
MTVFLGDDNLAQQSVQANAVGDGRLYSTVLFGSVCQPEIH